MPNKKTHFQSIYLSTVYASVYVCICQSSLDFSHLSSPTLSNEYDGKTVYIVYKYHLAVIAQLRRKVTPKTHTHTHTEFV